MCEGDEAESRLHLGEALRLFRRVSDRPGLTDTLEAVAMLALHREHNAHATQLFGAASRMRVELDQPPPASDQAEFKAATGTLHSEMGDDGFRSEWESGKKLSIDAAADCAQDELGSDPSSFMPSE